MATLVLSEPLNRSNLRWVSLCVASEGMVKSWGKSGGDHEVSDASRAFSSLKDSDRVVEVVIKCIVWY